MTRVRNRMTVLLSTASVLMICLCSCSEDSESPDNGDHTAPTTPTGLVASPVSSTRIDLVWEPSADNVRVTGYMVYRNGIQFDLAAATSSSDMNLIPSTQYCYAVSAIDSAGNQSAKSQQVCASTKDPNTYEVWGGNVPQVFTDYDSLGTSSSTHEFSGSYPYYLIVTRSPDRIKLDAVQFSDGTYLQNSCVFDSNTEDCQNASGSPDGQFALIGICQSCPPGQYGQYLGGYVQVANIANGTSLRAVVLP
jgi:hypothetical protein